MRREEERTFLNLFPKRINLQHISTPNTNETKSFSCSFLGGSFYQRLSCERSSPESITKVQCHATEHQLHGSKESFHWKNTKAPNVSYLRGTKCLTTPS